VHGVTSQNAFVFILTTARNSNITSLLRISGHVACGFVSKLLFSAHSNTASKCCCAASYGNRFIKRSAKYVIHRCYPCQYLRHKSTRQTRSRDRVASVTGIHPQSRETQLTTHPILNKCNSTVSSQSDVKGGISAQIQADEAASSACVWPRAPHLRNIDKPVTWRKMIAL
jgi:hypothetical protein